MARTTRFYLNTTRQAQSSPTGAYVLWDEKIKDGKSPKITLEADRSSAVRVIDTAWENWPTLAKAILGYTRVGTNGYTLGSNTTDGNPCLIRATRSTSRGV